MTTRDTRIQITNLAADYPLHLLCSSGRERPSLPIDATLTEVETVAGWLAAAVYVDDTEIQTAGLTWEVM